MDCGGVTPGCLGACSGGVFPALVAYACFRVFWQRVYERTERRYAEGAHESGGAGCPAIVGVGYAVVGIIASSSFLGP